MIESTGSGIDRCCAAFVTAGRPFYVVRGVTTTLPFGAVCRHMTLFTDLFTTVWPQECYVCSCGPDLRSYTTDLELWLWFTVIRFCETWIVGLIIWTITVNNIRSKSGYMEESLRLRGPRYDVCICRGSARLSPLSCLSYSCRHTKF